MRIDYCGLEECGAAGGTVVVIDVLRAFTTAASAFLGGARQILLVSTVQEALALRARFPDARTMGEVDALPIPEFDHSNSPTEIEGLDLRGRRLIQRTTAGTQGIVRSVRAEALFAASFVCAGATARAIARRAPASVTFVITGVYPDRDGDEDRACADYIAALLRDERPDPAPYLRRVRESDTGRWFADPALPAFPAPDLERALALDRLDRALLVRRREDLLVMAPVPAPAP